MQIRNIAQLLESSSSIQILRMRNATWILPFLYRVYKESDRFSISEMQLTTMLSDLLVEQGDNSEDWEEVKIEQGENEESRARKYLFNWVQKRILQDFPDAEGHTMYQLSSYTEKVFQWLQSLDKRDFVGTESRFKMLFTSLKEIVEKTEDDKNKRLEELKNRRAEIDREIKALEFGAPVEVYSNAQVHERLDLFTKLCYELLSDFREVEDNFKQIHRDIVEQHTKAESNKGAIIGYAFEAYDALRHSNQGKSFYGFWDFLISRAGQEEWRLLMDQLVTLLEDRNINNDALFLQNIKSLLLHQGRTVYEANDKMAEKLSRIITEKEIARHRRLRQQINSVKNAILEVMEDGEVPFGLEIEDGADIKIVMDRRINLELKQPLADVKQPSVAIESIEDPERFGRLLQMSHIDKKKLWGKVENVLKTKQTVTLREIIEQEKLEHGVGEIISYYSFLRDKGARVQVLANMKELIPLDESETRFIEVPYLLFGKIKEEENDSAN